MQLPLNCTSVFKGSSVFFPVVITRLSPRDGAIATRPIHTGKKASDWTCGAHLPHCHIREHPGPFRLPGFSLHTAYQIVITQQMGCGSFI